MATAKKKKRQTTAPKPNRSKERTQKTAASRAKQNALEIFWESTHRKGGVQKLATGISGFDQTLQGGIPEGRALLITGPAGSGKTVFLNEFLYRGATEFDQPGVFITFEERPSEISKNVKNFGWDYDALVKKKELMFVDASPELQNAVEMGDAEWLPAMLARIKSAIKAVGAKRAAIDNVATIFEKYKRVAKEEDIRQTLFLLADELKKMGVTVMMSAERSKDSTALSRYGIEEYVADGVLDLSVDIGQNRILRTLNIKKMRGVGYRSGSVEFDISSEGVEVYPKIPIDISVASTEFSKKEPFGIAILDDALDGGIPQGHMVMVGGNTGTGKTTLAMHFIVEGLKRGESAVWVALEESVPQIKKTALEHGWNLERYEKKGLLHFVSTSLIDIGPNKLLYQIVDAANSSGAKRLVLDSVSSMESGTMGKDKVREFLIQMTVFLKTVGTACVMNYLSNENFIAAGSGLLGTLNSNDMRLSSIVDGIILLRYTERDYTVAKLLNILKMRGTQHDKRIFGYEITKKGIKLQEAPQT